MIIYDLYYKQWHINVAILLWQGEQRERKQCIVGYFTIWEHNSKHTRLGNSQYKMQNYLDHHKTTTSKKGQKASEETCLTSRMLMQWSSLVDANAKYVIAAI